MRCTCEYQKWHFRGMSSDGRNVRKQKKRNTFTGTMEENVAYGQLKKSLSMDYRDMTCTQPCKHNTAPTNIGKFLC
jgi:hypothetical protein